VAGTEYVALSGLRSRFAQLDQLAADIANSGTTGYKGTRQTGAAAPRAAFGDTLQTAIDATSGGTQVDMTPGELVPTGRALDVAVDGNAFFVVSTPNGPRYTQDGHFLRANDGTLTTEGGQPVMGTNGPITLGAGDPKIDANGAVWSGSTQVGQLAVVTFANPQSLTLDGASTFNANGATPTTVSSPSVHPGMLEASNVSMSDRLAELTELSRNFEALQKAISLTFNDVTGRAIDVLGKP
jgi:flagellar basal-body rod protein FlgF